MTLEEFEAQRRTMPCPGCGVIGELQIDHNVNNNGKRPTCPCGWRGQWLPQNASAAARRLRRPPGTPSPEEVWKANGDHCGFCGKPRWFCERIGIGLTVQHVQPVVFGGGDGPLCPFCARCQQASVAALEETRRVLGEVDNLDSIIKRIEEHNPELRG